MHPTDDNVPNGLPGQWTPPPIELDQPQKGGKVQHFLKNTYLIPALFTEKDCCTLIETMHRYAVEAPVGVSGYSSNRDEPGSHRATAWSPPLAQQFWKRMRHCLPSQRTMNHFTATDWYALGDRKEYWQWTLVGVSPLLRFMRYQAGGQHYGHYDMGYDYPDSRRTLISFVLYLSTTKEGMGGATRFLIDGQENLPIHQRKHDDWTRPATEKEIFCCVTPVLGSVLFFDHRMCHDVELYQGKKDRYIIRGDIIYSAKGWSCTGS